MSGFITDIRGVNENNFSIGNNIDLQSSSSSLDLKRIDNEEYVETQVGNISNISTHNTSINLFSLKSSLPLIEFIFEGMNPPSPGDNSGKFGLCTSEGGEYEEKDIVYDNGESLVFIPYLLIRGIITTSRIESFSQILESDSIYYVENGELISKGGSSKGVVQYIELRYDWNTPLVQSETLIPENCLLLETINYVEEVFDNPLLKFSLKVSGSIPLTLIEESDEYLNLTSLNTYVNPTIYRISSSLSGKLFLEFNNEISLEGSGSVLVKYVIPKN